MRVLFISSYPPAKEGVGEYTAQMVTCLELHGADVRVLTMRDGNNSSERVHRLISWRPSSIRQIQKITGEFKPEIIHVQYAVSIYRTYNALLLLLLHKWRRTSNVKVIFTFHEPIQELSNLGFIGRVYYKLVNKLCDEINVLTPESKKTLQTTCDIEPTKIKVVTHGVFRHEEKANITKQLRKRYGLVNNKVVLFFGYIHINKGIDVLIEAFNILIKSLNDPSLVLLVAGSIRPRKGIFKLFERKDKKYLDVITNRIHDLGITDRVKFAGFIPSGEKWSTLRLAEVIVLPYTKAEQSGVLNTVLSSERPIIASNIGGFRDLLRDSGGLVPPNDPVKLANIIERVLTDHSFRTSIVRSNERIEAEKSIDRVMGTQLKNYQILIKTASGARQ